MELRLLLGYVVTARFSAGFGVLADLARFRACMTSLPRDVDFSVASFSKDYLMDTIGKVKDPPVSCPTVCLILCS